MTEKKSRKIVGAKSLIAHNRWDEPVNRPEGHYNKSIMDLKAEAYLGEEPALDIKTVCEALMLDTETNLFKYVSFRYVSYSPEEAYDKVIGSWDV